MTNIFSWKKKFNEKIFKPDFQGNNLVLPRAGRTMRGNSGDNVISIPVSPSVVQSIPNPGFAAMRSEAVDVPASASADPYKHSHDFV